MIYQALSDYTTGYHSSDGAYGAGNYYGIGIEICVNGFPGTYSGEAVSYTHLGQLISGGCVFAG